MDGRVHLPGLEGKYLCIDHTDLPRDEAGTCPLDGKPLHPVGGIIGPMRTKMVRGPSGEGRGGHGAHAGGKMTVGGLSLPRDAVLTVGHRHLAFLEKATGVFVPVDLTLGPRGDRAVAVLSGLEEGDRVLAEANFGLDSEEELPPPPEEAPVFFVQQSHCPVMGRKIDRDVFVDHEGVRVYFCCPSCDDTFRTDPEKYLKALEVMGEEPIPVPDE
jgi:YHS domain-containing protein